jgi:hypothetical protein
VKEIVRYPLAKIEHASAMFPDVATDGKTVVCCFVESQWHHLRVPSGLWIAISEDQGRTWNQEMIRCAPSGKFYNSPRIVYDGPGKFIIVVDVMPVGGFTADFMSQYGDEEEISITSFETKNGGKDWSERQMKAYGICPSLFLDTQGIKKKLVTQIYNKVTHRWEVIVCDMETGERIGGRLFSTDESTGRIASSEFDLCEGSLVRTGNSLVMLARCNSSSGLPGMRSISLDDGRTWGFIEQFCLPGGMHRPTIIKLRSDHFFASFRFFPACGYNQNTFAAVMPAHTLVAPRHLQTAVIRPIDFNPNPESDQGYTGACELNDGTILVVNYGNFSGQHTEIVYYRISPSDFLSEGL